MSSNCQATLTTEAQALEVLWHDSEQGKAFKAVGSPWCDIHVGIYIILYSILVWTHITLLLAPAEKILVCILCLTEHTTQNITPIGDCGGTNVSEGEYIKTLTNRRASEVQSVPGADKSYQHRCSGESHQTQPRTPPEDACLGQGPQSAPLRQPLVHPDREVSDQGISSFKDPSKAHLTKPLCRCSFNKTEC